MTAYPLMNEAGPVSEWLGTEARIIGGRLAANLGSTRLSRWLEARAWLADRQSMRAACFHAINLQHSRGPLAAWRFLGRLPKFEHATDQDRGNLLLTKAELLGSFRDFERADQLLDESEKLGAIPSWLLCARARLLAMRDDLDGALTVAQEALQMRPWYRVAVQQAASYLQSLNRDAEARALLSASLSHVESGAVAGQLAGVEFELGLHRESLDSWQRMLAWSPLADQWFSKWIASRLADAHYHCGEYDEAHDHARQAGEGFYQEFADRLAGRPGMVRKVKLPVTFVRQHHFTCAPATLSALSHYWNLPVDHAALAAEICYDGTPDHVERHWALQNGYVVREFSVTWDTTVALLDRGVPFTLTTTEATSGHLQAVIGYDELRRTLLIRDPYQRIHREVGADEFLEPYLAHGPRGMILLPPGEAPRLDGVELPEAEFYDEYYALRRALHTHDRAAAQAALERMLQRDAVGRMTSLARRQLAAYDGDYVEQLAAVNALLERFPETRAFLLEKLWLLRQITNYAECQAFLRPLAAGKKADVVFWYEWSRELARDTRDLAAAMQYALCAVRVAPMEATHLHQLANLLWEEGRFEAATELYRFATCLRDKLEGFSQSYFLACRHVRQTEESLAWLQERQQRYGRQSGYPARSLFWALSALHRSPEAFAMLEQAIAGRPEDGELLLYAADAFARSGNWSRAGELLVAAESCSARQAWLRAAAAVANYRGDAPRALAWWREVLAVEPLAVDAQQNVARLVAEVEGRAQALAVLQALSVRFPYHLPLRRQWIYLLRSEGASAQLPVIQQMLEIAGNDAWTRRELANCLANLQQWEPAKTEAALAAQIEPGNPISACTQAEVCLAAGELETARHYARESLRLSIDHAPAMSILLQACPAFEQKLEALTFIHAELIRQIVFGEGLLSYRELAFPVLPPPDLLQNLQHALRVRPDLWHSWSVVVRQLMDSGQLEEALKLADQAVERFPLVPRGWFDLALVRQTLRDPVGQIAALRRALEINPTWVGASEALAAAYGQTGDRGQQRRVLEEAVTASPLEIAPLGQLAGWHWRHGDKKVAVESMERVLQLDPTSGMAWNLLRDWSKELGDEGRTVELARELTGRRPGEANSWLCLAQSMDASRLDERLAALDRAIEMDPRFLAAHDLRAVLLVGAKRYEEALVACNPAAYADSPSMNLVGRAAWVMSQKGDVPVAIAKIQEAVARWPNYSWGWELLAELLVREQRFREALEAVQNLIRLNPRSAIPQGWMADILLRLDEKGEAVRCLRRAFEIDHSYGYAGYKIFELELQGRELTGAARTLALLESHLPGAATTSCRIRLHCAQKNRTQALDEMQAFCTEPGENETALRQAAQAFGNMGWQRELERLCFELLDHAKVNPVVGAIWVELFTARKAWGYRRRLYALNGAMPLGRRARLAYLTATAKMKQPQFAKKLASREEKLLRADTEDRGQVGYAYVTGEAYNEAIHWLGDWRRYPAAEPWMLYNASIGYRVKGREAEAREVNLHAITLPDDRTTGWHHLWLACEDAAMDNVPAARERLRHVQEDTLGPLSKAAYSLTCAIVAVEEAPAAERRAVFQQRRLILKQAIFQGAFSSRSLRRLASRGIRKMARDAGARPFTVGSVFDLTFTKNRRPLSVRSILVFAWLGCVLLGTLVRSCSPDDGSQSSTASTLSPPVNASAPLRPFPPANGDQPHSSLDLDRSWQFAQPGIDHLNLKLDDSPTPASRIFLK
ncbi:MAG: C39 family peptidase [Chthoniobacteraceae bacterium]